MLGLGLAWGMIVLAAAAGDAPVSTDATQRDIIRVRQRQPWLRINAGGHTGAVRGLAFTFDGTRLCSGGLDKVVQVWNLRALPRDVRRIYLRERTLRWQVARGLRGSIYAVAAAPDADLVAFGGYGAESLGEIPLVDPVQGKLMRVLQGHRQTVCGLAFSADGKWLASSDTAGEARLWHRPTWQSERVLLPDEDRYGAKWARRIEQLPKLRPITIAGSSHVFLPVLKDRLPDGRLRWLIRRVALADRKEIQALEPMHYGMVSALAASRDGSRLASADLEGNLYLWELSSTPEARRLAKGPVIGSLCFSPDGATLVAGTEVSRETNRAELQIWDTATPRLTDTRSLPDHPLAAAISPDGRQLAYSGGKDHEIFVERLGASRRPVELHGTGKRVLKVAFAAKEPFYRVAFGTEPHERPKFNDYAPLQQSFDTTKLALEAGGPPNPPDWIPVESRRGNWRARVGRDGGLELLYRGVVRGRIELDPRLEGRPRSYCWIPARRANEPFAVAVGTDTQNSIYVYRLAPRGPLPILRHFRGHHGFVSSLGVSQDGRYLVSGAADGTIRFWSLSGYEQGSRVSSRWGAEFDVEDGRLVARAVHPAGPLYGKGVRAGDVLRRIRWLERSPQVAQGEERTEERPAEILRRLREANWEALPRGAMVLFESARDGKRRPPFQLVPAWQPLATLFVNTRGEWAFWTPAGYYDASVNGYRLFGWQVNRGLANPPDFFRADQFYKRLERPDVMSRLLPAGSLRAAFEQAALAPPRGAMDRELSEQIAATPRIRILAPESGILVRENSTRVRARVEVPPGRSLTRTRVFANGVVAVGEKLVGSEELGEGRRALTYEWDAPLPRDSRNLIQIVVGTDAPTAAFRDVIIEREPAPAPPPKLYLLALGINEYGDPEIQPLEFSVADAQAMVDMLRSRSKGVYALDEAALLTDRKVTPRLWREAVQRVAEKLRAAARPDDLLVFFLAGHGILDEQTREYLFVGHGFDLSEFNREACISWRDFQLLADIPCRKVVLLDTCHSGAIQPPRSGDLKRAVRRLQEDVIFTVTASTGEQRSAEKKSWGHGAFTKCLLEALGGRADASGDGVVTLDELVSYVKTAVPELTAGVQTPTAAPDEILPFTSLPLTRAQ